jgi:7,8-dihydroneopterin aldolase/epimerase/oxygenase
MPDSLVLQRLRFFAHHGVLPAEAAHGQFFEVSVRLELPLATAAQADDLSLTVDYQDVYNTVGAVLDGPRHKLVETLAELVAQELLKTFPCVEAVEVEIIKPAPPVAFSSGGLGVKIRREQK